MKKSGILYFFSQPDLTLKYFTIAKIIEDNCIKYQRSNPGDLTQIEMITLNQLNATEYLIGQ